ncbi:restriction endonuclease subunit S [Rathayibacter sp. AY2B5]|uniref:restriction endonuclease subunit S n=1 Tax=Rathayibacter sp. AY2B5 TaxID=2080570 RepID=UPI000CE91F23|nr:restriction endonuclease subunit S [Rathayibacter sp. AY2B5]PPG44394.1 hypothetical protein C5C30_02450 [Rathayibacter sp. AY2B5]
MAPKTLGEISTFITKGATPTTYGYKWQAFGVPFLRSECVSGRGLDMRQSMFISEAADQSLRRSRVKDGDILMTITGNVGRVVRLAGIGSANINQHIARVRIKDRNFDPGYVYHFLSQDTMREYYESIVTGQAFPQISLVQVRSTPVPEMGIEEQKTIARALDDADNLVVALEGLITKRQAIKHGMRQDLLSGRVRLPGHTAPWAEARLGSLGKAIRGVAYEPDADLSSSDQSFTVRLLRSNNVQDGQIVRRGLQFVHERRVSSAQVLASGDIVICMANGSRALVGKAALFEPKRGEPHYTFGAFMGAFRTDQSVASPRYIAELMRTHVFRNWLDVLLSGSSINNLRPGDIEGFVASLPSLPEQVAIAETLGDVDQEIDQLGERLAKARAIKQGMMQHLLTGRVHLPVEAAE